MDRSLYKCKQKELTISASSDDLTLSVLITAPVCGFESYKGIIQIVHGMCEHKERYIPMMNYFSDYGYVCVIHDQRGHGKSVKCNDDLGYFYDGGWKSIVEDVRIVNEVIRSIFAGPKVIMVGHGFGSLVARSFAMRYPQMIKGLFVSGSSSKIHMLHFSKYLLKGLQLFRGDRYRPKNLQKRIIKHLNKSFDAKSSFAWMSSDIDVQNEYERNPLCNFAYTINGLICILSVMQDCYGHKTVKNDITKNLFVYFLFGKDDPCMISNPRLLESVRDFSKKGFPNSILQIFREKRHDLFSGKGNIEVWDYVLKRVDLMLSYNLYK